MKHYGNPVGDLGEFVEVLTCDEYGGAGSDWIYSSHGYNEIWTGAGDDHLALVYGHGTIYCNGPGVKTFVMRSLPQNRPWTLVGCTHKVLVRYRA